VRKKRVDIKELDISARSKACLLRAGYETTEDLDGITDEELLEIKNINQQCVDEIRAALEDCSENSFEEIEVANEKPKTSKRSDERDDELKRAGDLFKRIQTANFQKEESGRDDYLDKYPDTVRRIAENKDSSWEYLLLIEASLHNYSSLRDYRNRPVEFWKDTYAGTKIDSNASLSKYMSKKLEALKGFAEKISECLNEDIAEAVGAPGEEGDDYKVIKASEKLLGIYKSVIAWRLSFGHINAAPRFRAVLEEMCSLGEGLCQSYDKYMKKMADAKKQLEDLNAGLIEASDVEIDLTWTLDVDFGKFDEELSDLTD